MDYELTDGKKERKEFNESKDDLFQKQLERIFEDFDYSNELLCNVEQGISVLKIIEQSLNITKKGNL